MIKKTAETQKQLIEWAQCAKGFMQSADTDPAQMPTDAQIMRATVAFNMLLRNGAVRELDDMGRSHAIAVIASNFADDPATTPTRAALFAVRLEDT